MVTYGLMDVLSICYELSTKEQPVRSNLSVDIAYLEWINAQGRGGLIYRVLE